MRNRMLPIDIFWIGASLLFLLFIGLMTGILSGLIGLILTIKEWLERDKSPQTRSESSVEGTDELEGHEDSEKSEMEGFENSAVMDEED